MRPPRSQGSEAGFSLVELMVAATVLVVGLLGALTMLDGANRATTLNSARIGAVNLSRELVEYARSADYAKLDGAQLPAYLQSRPNMGGGSANPFTVTRGGVTYTVRVSTCIYDDAHDGMGGAGSKPTDAGQVWCAPTGTTYTTSPDANPDDFRRVTFDLSWRSRGTASAMSQSTLVVNPSGGLGPRITKIATEPSAQITGGRNGLVLHLDVTTDPASALHWRADVPAQGEASPNGTPPVTGWKLDWNLGAYGVDGFVVDGIYTMSMQAFDARGVPGEQRFITIPLNRSRPLAPATARGGRNERFGGVVDLTWAPSAERDVIGYQVDRYDPATGTWMRVCPASGDVVTGLFCTDTSSLPNTGTLTYRVRAMDRADVLDASSSVMPGDPATVQVAEAGAAPATPRDLTVTVGADGRPQLTWTDPNPAGTVSLFRIYRDGTALTDRYDSVPGGVLSYKDPNPGTTAHTYRVSAVGASFNESSMSSPAP